MFVCDGEGKEGPYLPIDILRRGLDVARLAVDAAGVSDSLAQETWRVALCTYVYVCIESGRYKADEKKRFN